MSRGKKKTEADEVDELLRAAEDDVYLKLSLNSHMARGSSTKFIDPDLDQRFQALKSKKKPNKNLNSQKSTSNPPSSDSVAASRIDFEKNPPSSDSLDASRIDFGKDPDKEDDLLARFAALQSTLPSYSSGSTSDKRRMEVGNEEDEDEDDEVEKMIKWAIDAARLDPSPPSDSDDENNDVCDTSSDDDDEDEDEDSDTDLKPGQRKAKRKS